MARLLVMMVSNLLLCACSHSSPHVPDKATDTKSAVDAVPACCQEIEPAGVLPDLSIYQLESVWTSQEGKRIALSHFRGRPTLVAMMFTTCEYACPRILADMKAIESKLSAADRERVRFVLVSFDTEHDRSAVLHAYAKENHLDLTRWTLLHGSEDSVRELAAVLGIKYKRSKAVGFSHSNLITVLDTEGRVAYQQQGIGASPVLTLKALAKRR